ncbi:prepilin peptidase [Ventosimonas gracilis]|uniref:prepilin peptidase n=1 Tax=Ventosimonas gracilis TaxID=1680762 RepID=UPI000AC1AC60
MQAVAFLAENIPMQVISALLLGMIVGSFLNVVVYRLPKMLLRDWQVQAREVLGLPAEPQQSTFNLMLPRSRCPHCGHAIRSWENIPLFSYLMLGGKCANCKTSISLRYPLVELFAGLISALVVWHFGLNWQAAAMLLLSWGLLAMSLIDADHQLLPDALVLPLLWLGLLVNSQGLFVPLADALWGAALGYLSLWSIYWLFKLITGKEGMGYGDFKLLAMLGAWGGWQVLPMTVLLSSLTGAVLGIIFLRLRGQDSNTTLPFGPYLALAGWLALLFGEQISSHYLKLFAF